MATKQTVSKQSAKLPITGSTPVVASFHTCYMVVSAEQMEAFMDLFPCWFIGDKMEEEKAVWVFNVTGQHYFFPYAVFSTREIAEQWILRERPAGVLTKYLLDVPEDQSFPEHYHYEEEEDFEFLEQKIRASGEMEDAPALKADEKS